MLFFFVQAFVWLYVRKRDEKIKKLQIQNQELLCQIVALEEGVKFLQTKLHNNWPSFFESCDGYVYSEHIRRGNNPIDKEEN